MIPMTMYQYIIILGREAALAAAEIVASGIFENFDIKQSSNQFLLGLSSQPATTIAPLINKLGGTVKIAEVIKSLPTTPPLITAVDLKSLIKLQKGKINFGFSVYGERQSEIKGGDLEKLGKNLKKILVDQGQSCRFVTSQQNPLSSVIAKTQKLIGEKGYEFCLASLPHQTIIAKTIAVQDFVGYSRRDFGRPRRDMRQGLLPPKLAQILLNLARLKPNDVILDPFCGDGTILQEALLLGARQVIGCDINPQAIIKTKQNLDWLKTKLPFTGEWLVYQYDAKQFNKHLKLNSIDAIITEPWLGPINPPRTIAEQQQLINELVELYHQALINLMPLLKTGGYISMVVPNIGNFSSAKQLPTLKNLQPVPLLSAALANLFKVDGTTLTYRRPNQMVGREIMVFTKSASNLT